VRFVIACVLASVVVAGAVAVADEFEPVRLTVTAPAAVRTGAPMTVSVAVDADPGELDVRTGALSVRAKLAPGQCGATFDSTTGTPVLDGPLAVQPVAGQPFHAEVRRTRKAPAAGKRTVCTFLEQDGDQRQFASDIDSVVDVTYRSGKLKTKLRCRAARSGTSLRVTCSSSSSWTTASVMSFRLLRGTSVVASKSAPLRGHRATARLTRKGGLRAGRYVLRAALTHNGRTAVKRQPVHLR
jgi:hypothetical protein